jgi:PKD repeat protein
MLHQELKMVGCGRADCPTRCSLDPILTPSLPFVNFLLALALLQLYLIKMFERRTPYFFFLLIAIWCGLIPNFATAQNLFLEECFVGGVTTGGANTLGSVEGSLCEIRWEENYSLRAAYAITYRHGQPGADTMSVNDTPVIWNSSNQFGEEQPEINPGTLYYATHVKDITQTIVINGSTVSVDIPANEVDQVLVGQGFWSIHVVLLYEAPQLTEPVCLRIYTADQPQENIGQTYQFEKPTYNESEPLLFSIYSDRISEFESDRSRILLNSQILGDIWCDDLFSLASHGVQGTFYYENSEAFGLNGDTANTQVLKHDGIAVINDYLSNDLEQTLQLFRVENFPTIGTNIHPAFLLTYTPECTVLEDEATRTYSFCHGDTIQLEAPVGYDSYLWSDNEGLSDVTIPNPLCFVDSSRWYTLTMTSADGSTCDQTIPVFIEVYDNPVPASLTVRASLCPANTGEIIANGTPGNQPITYNLNGTENTTGAVGDLAPGTYALDITTATGCTWDTTVTVLLNPVQEASFTATPETGFSPLDVFFNNTSTQATDYQWLIDGVPISTSEDITYTFPDSGSFVVSLIAYRLEETCADTATFTLRVEPGIQVLMPNIITPNSDGRNDVLVAQVQGVVSCRWVIYNRWGNEVASGSHNDVFQTVELWQPEGEVTAGQYTVVLVAEGQSAFAEAAAGRVEKMVFEVTVAR